MSSFLDIGLLNLSLDHQRLVERLVEGRVEVTLLQLTWRRQLGVLDGRAGCGNLPNQVDFGSSRFPEERINTVSTERRVRLTFPSAAPEEEALCPPPPPGSSNHSED